MPKNISIRGPAERPLILISLLRGNGLLVFGASGDYFEYIS